MPEGWLKEMGCNSQDERSNYKNIECTSETETESSKSAERSNIRPKLKQQPKVDDEYRAPRPFLDSVKSIVFSVFTAMLAGLAYYLISTRSAVLKAPNRGLTASVNVDATILDVYDYLSTPDFRTEWHFGAVEITGPAIDHSAIPGKSFNEHSGIISHCTRIQFLTRWLAQVL